MVPSYFCKNELVAGISRRGCAQMIDMAVVLKYFTKVPRKHSWQCFFVKFRLSVWLFDLKGLVSSRKFYKIFQNINFWKHILATICQIRTSREPFHRNWILLTFLILDALLQISVACMKRPVARDFQYFRYYHHAIYVL